MVGILRDPNFASSLWGIHLYESLVRALKDKRIAFCEPDSVCPPDLDGVFVIAAEREWIESVLVRLNAGGHRPILLCNQAEQLPGCIYSSVCSDLNASMKELLESLTRLGKKRIALYGINTDSVSDLGRVDSLYVWRSADTVLQVFPNEGSLEACYAAFSEQADVFDAVICSNDFAAVSLVRRLSKEDRARLTVVSCSASKISDAYPEIRSLRMNFDRSASASRMAFKRSGWSVLLSRCRVAKTKGNLLRFNRLIMPVLASAMSAKCRLLSYMMSPQCHTFGLSMV